MKINKPFSLFVPVDAVEMINSKVKRNREIYFYIIHYLMIVPTLNKRYQNGYVPINCKEIQRIICNNPKTYKNLLEKYELIQSDKLYFKGKKSLYYRINPAMLTNAYIVEVKPGCSLYRSLWTHKKNERTNDSKLEPYLKEMLKAFMQLSFNYDAAFKWISSVSDNNKRNSYNIAMLQLMDQRERYFKRNTTNNRLDTNLTNLKKDLRQFIKGDFVSIDLVNSQPFFLFLLIDVFGQNDLLTLNYNTIQPDKHTHIPLCSEIKLKSIVKTFGLQQIKDCAKNRKINEMAFFTNLSKYKNWTCSGLFYDNFIKHFANKYDRDEIKKIMFAVLFSQNEMHSHFRRYVPYEKEKKLFAEVFPVISDMITKLKRKDHSSMAIYLQRLEAEIFIDNIAKRLCENGIVPLTIHDSVIVETKYQSKALQIMQGVFMQAFGIVPQFKAEMLHKRNETAKVKDILTVNVGKC